MTLYFQAHIQMKESILKECSGIDNTKIFDPLLFPTEYEIV